MAKAPLFNRLALIGIGLIGSSVARIARQRSDLAGEIVAYEVEGRAVILAEALAERVAQVTGRRLGAPLARMKGEQLEHLGRLAVVDHEADAL